MSEHHALISWKKSDAPFTYESYSRDHTWTFGTGHTLAASAAEAFRGNPANVNPEEALVGAASSCHMLTFLAIAARKGLAVESYSDDAVGVLEKGPDHVMRVTRITLRPKIVFAAGVSVSEPELAALHHQAHKGCFIANSIKSEITVE